MIVFGFYGTGKSEYCKNNPNCCDLDFEYFYFNQKDNSSISEIKNDYIKTVKDKEKLFDIVFINRFFSELDISFGFIQKDYELCKKILSDRKQGNFMPDINEFNEVSSLLFKEGIIVPLNKNEFIGNYDKTLMNKVIEQKEVEYER